MTASTDKFKRHVTALAGIYYRIDRGTNTGRNANGTESAIEWHMREARALLKAELHDDASPLFAYLDAHPKFAAKWDGLERRYVGLPS